MPPPVVSLSQINKRKRNFVPKVAIRLPSVQPNPPPSSRQTTISESAGNVSHDAGIDFEMAQSLGSRSPVTSQRVLPVVEITTTPNPPTTLSASVASRLPPSTFPPESSTSAVRNHSQAQIRALPTPISIPSRVPPSPSVHATSPTTSHALRVPPAGKQRRQTVSTSARPGPPSPRREAANTSDHVIPDSTDPSVFDSKVSQPISAALVASTSRSGYQEEAPHTSVSDQPLFIEPEGGEAAIQEMGLGPDEREATAKNVESAETIAGDGNPTADHTSSPPMSLRKRLTRAGSRHHSHGHATESGAETQGDDNAGDEGDDYLPLPTRKRRRARGTASTMRSTPKKTRKPRKKRRTAEQVAQEDAEAQGKEHDPTLTTMSALVEDLPVGRPTSARQHIQERIRANRARDRARREQLRVADRNITLDKRRDETEEDASRRTLPRVTLDATADGHTHENRHNDADLFAERAGDDNDGHSEGEGNDFFADIPTSGHVAQISINDEGMVVADELQMEVDRPDTSQDHYERVFERDADRFVNSLSHSKRHKGSTRWSQAETAIFYDNLAMYGTDFESIARVMPGRTRHEIKNKFNAEDKRNSQLINEFLFQRKPIDLDEAGRMTGKDLSGPPPQVRGEVESTRQDDNQTAETVASPTIFGETDTITIGGASTGEQPPDEMFTVPEPSLVSAPLDEDPLSRLPSPEDN